MEARVKQDFNAGPIMAFSGHEYIKKEWRNVPAGSEEEAKRHPFLDTRETLTVDTRPLEDIGAIAELPSEEPTMEAPTLEEIRNPRRNRKARKGTEASE